MSQTLKRNIMTLKDRTRSTVHSVPYIKMPLLVIEALAKQAQSMLHAFPTKTGISTTLSARNAIKERPNLNYNIMSIQLVLYVKM